MIGLGVCICFQDTYFCAAPVSSVPQATGSKTENKTRLRLAHEESESVHIFSMSLQATGSKVERVVITRLENHTYFSRIVLSLPGGAKRSVDARPSDSLALGLQCEAPLFVARHLAE